jgi:hypothetical protein
LSSGNDPGVSFRDRQPYPLGVEIPTLAASFRVTLRHR